MRGEDPGASTIMPEGASPGLGKRHRGLSWRLTGAFLILVSAVLLLNGAINMGLAYREARVAATTLQREKALSAAERVQQFVSGIESQMGWTTRSEWSRVPLEQRRYDLIRLLRQAPALTEVVQIDGAGKEQIRMSRLEPDSIGSGKDYSEDAAFLGALERKVWYGPVYFRSGSEPYMTLAIAHQGRSPGVTLGSVNLKLVWDVISAIRIGQDGYAFVTDREGKLVAYQDMSLVLRGTDLGAVPDIRDVLNGSSSRAEDKVEGLNGRMVLRAHVAIPRLGWIVFVDLPTREVLEPVWTAFWQTGGLLALGILIAGVLGAWMARRMVEPIKRLQHGADKFGEGHLAERVEVPAGDEIGILAQRFNAMADRIQEAQETLEAKVATRTRELAQSLDDLRNAQDRLVQTEKLASLGQLTAGIAHEIKNPLNFVNNFSELSRDLLAELLELVERPGQVPDEIRSEVRELADLLRGNLEKIMQHGQRADSIVRSMLLHSRGQGGEHRKLALNAAVEETLNLAYHGARAEMPEFNVDLVTALDPSAGEADVYPQEFTRVLLNLFGNAFHALRKMSMSSPPAGWAPRLEVSTRGDASSVTVVVRDNGTGIPQALKDRIFEPFFTTKPAGEGTGLGLSLSHDIIVKQHGGQLIVDSHDGEGACFTIVLPRRQKEAVAAA